MKKSRLCMFFLCAAMLMALPVILPPGIAVADPGSITAFIAADIVADTTWHKGAYFICSTEHRATKVTNGATLTIEPGSTVYFSKDIFTAVPGTKDKFLHPSLRVTNGSLVARGVTFTTIPDASWQGKGWWGIEALGVPESATNLTFTDCTFEYSAAAPEGTLRGTQTNGVNSEVNITVTGCTFRDPRSSVNANATAIRYDNGTNTEGRGNIVVSNSTFTGYGRGVQILDNKEDMVNTTVTDCTFTNMSLRPLEINGGKNASVTGCTFNNFVAGQHSGAVLIFDTYPVTRQSQEVTLSGNTFNYGDGTNIYPVQIGAGCRINENLTVASDNIFGEAYPEEYRYIQLTTDVGHAPNGAYREAVWGDGGIPYLLAKELSIGASDGTNQSSLTIKPGATVCLGDGKGNDNLFVKGTLIAEGTEDKPITFTRKTGVDYGNEILVTNNLKGRVTLKHCIMDGLYRGIGVISPSSSGGLISLENCTVQNTREPMVINGNKVSVRDCTFFGKGIWMDGVSGADFITIEGCTITGEGENFDYGFGTQACKSVALKNCLITGFGSCGISVLNNSFETLAEGAPLIENCTVSGNSYGVIFSKNDDPRNYTYSSYIKNSIIAGNTELDLVNRAFRYGEADYPLTMPEESISYSLVGNDGSSLFNGSDFYEDGTFGIVCKIEETVYSNPILGDPLFADTKNGDYHLKSAEGRWDGSGWVADTATSPCINAGDPESTYANEPDPNGGRINLGCYGNTAEASKSTSIPPPTVTSRATAATADSPTEAAGVSDEGKQKAEEKQKAEGKQKAGGKIIPIVLVVVVAGAGVFLLIGQILLRKGGS